MVLDAIGWTAADQHVGDVEDGVHFRREHGRDDDRHGEARGKAGQIEHVMSSGFAPHLTEDPPVGRGSPEDRAWNDSEERRQRNHFAGHPCS